jgi:hypothetical protein
MLQRPSRVSLLPDVWDPDFATEYAAWAHQIRSEIKDFVAHTRATIEESEILIEEADRVLRQK